MKFNGLSKQLDENINNIIQIIQSDNLSCIELKKLLHYNDKKALLLNEAKSNLFMTNIFPFEINPYILEETKTMLNIYFNDFYLSDENKNYKDGVITFDILVPTSCEIILKNKEGVFGTRRNAIQEKIEKIINSSKELKCMGQIEFYRWFNLSVNDKYFGRRIMYSIKNMN